MSGVAKSLGLIGIGAVIGIAGLATVQTMTDSASAEETSALSQAVELSTVQVTQRDMVFSEDSTATLEFVSSTTVSSPAEGTVTSLLSAGETIEQGSIIATIDGTPVVAFFGDVPGWRDLDTSSDDGTDIYQLELNLTALGFDPDGEIEIDQEYDSATEDAVEAWQESLGLDADGDLAQSLITYVSGEILVDGASTSVGRSIQEGSSLLSGRIVTRSFAIPTVSEGDRLVEQVIAAGQLVTTGDQLFTVDGYPVIAIEADFATVPLLERDLSQASSDGSDIQLLEEALSALGFTADGELLVDDEFDLATSNAVAQWYASIGLTGIEATGSDADMPFDADDMTVPSGSFIVTPSDLEAGAALITDGTTLSADAAVLTLTTPSRLISTTAPLGDETFALGATMEVEFPDGTLETGTVVSVGSSASNSSGTPGETPSVPITISTPQIPESASGFLEIPVTLRIVTDTITEAYVVPVTALVALAEGGYALEVVDSSTATHLIAVTTGTFQDGFVEVSGDDLSLGMEVVVPS